MAGGWCTVPCLMVPSVRAVLVNAPFKKWHKKSMLIGSHSTKVYHLAVVENAELFLQSVEKPQT